MGLELTTRVTLTPVGAAAQTGDAKVLLESDELILRGAVRAKIRRADVHGATTRAGVVTVRFAGGVLTLSLGDDAPKFVKKLLEPVKSRLEKMGVTAGAHAVVLGVEEDALGAELAALDVTVAARATAGERLMLLGVAAARDLARIAVAAKSLAPDGALWVIHPKGVAGVKDTDIFAAGKAAGLTYTKVARFSETHTAEKLVWPKAARTSATTPAARR
jgi:hypothetical protein